MSVRPDARLLDNHSREALGELADVRVRRTEERVLRRRITDAGQARHVGDEPDAGEADAKIVGRHDGAKCLQVGTAVGQQRERRNDDALQDHADDQRAEIAETQRAETASGDPEQRRRQADRRTNGAHGVLRQPEVVVERVRHRPHHELGQPIEADHREHQQRQPPVDPKEFRERTDHRVDEAPAGPARRSRCRAAVGAPRWLDRDEARAQADAHQCGHHRIRDRPPRRLAEIRISESVTSSAPR